MTIYFLTDETEPKAIGILLEFLQVLIFRKGEIIVF